MTLTETITQAVNAAGIPGAVAMLGDRHGVQESVVIGQRGDGTAMTADTMFQLASMTKAITSVAAMQLVEQGRLALDAPIGDVLPDLASPQVITGFDEAGAALLRPAVRPITLRHLLTHTSGMGYDFVHAAQARARTAPVVPGSLASLRTPLLFDPGDDWAYGVNTDWAGLAVEAVSGQRLDAYVANHITGPLTMPDTMFGLDAAHKARLATLMLRGEDGALSPFPMNIGGGTEAEFIAGGAGLCGTAGDYMRFLRMILNGGSLEGTTILSHASIAEMTRNQIGGLRAGAMATTMPALSRAVDWFPEMTPGWGLGFLINPETSVDGRPAGSLAWAGIANTYFWIDPGTGLAGVLLMQLLPFADPGALGVLSAFERGVYK